MDKRGWTGAWAQSWVRRLLADPGQEVTRWQRAARFAYDLTVQGARQLREDRAAQTAAALAFRCLFAMLPVLVVATVVVKGVKGVDEFKRLVGWVVGALGLHDVQVVAPDSGAGAAADGAPAVGLGSWLEEVVGRLAEVRLQTLGWVGLAIVVYSAIALMVTIENSFNVIYRAPSGRSWTRRVPLYWFVLTVSPVAMGVTVFLDTRVNALIESMASWQWALWLLSAAWGFCIIWLVIFALYKLIPNASVTVRPALIGSFVAALLISVGKGFLASYFKNAFSFSYLYGTLGLIPVFMFWTYLMWLVVLFGLEVSATLQMLHGRRLKAKEELAATGMVDPAAVVAVMQLAAERFAGSRPATTQDCVQELGLPEPVVSRILQRLVERGYLHRLDHAEAEAVTLARPPDAVTADKLMEIGYSLVDDGTRGRRPALLRRLREAQQQLAAGATLASLIESNPPARTSQGSGA